MSNAHKHEVFKDSVNEYVHKRLMQVAKNYRGDPLDNIEHDFVSAGDRTIIKRVWFRRLTESDWEAIDQLLLEAEFVQSEGKDIVMSYGTDIELNLRIDDYFRENLYAEMQRQIEMLKDEKLRNGNQCA